MEFLAGFNHVLSLAQQDDNGGGGAAAGLLGMGFMCVFGVVYLAVIIAVVAGCWKLFVKAGEPGWAAIVPIYNTVIMIKICNKPLWWIVLALIPCTAPIFGILIAIELAKVFGKGIGYAIGLILLPIIFVPALGFGSAQYVGTKSF